MCPVPPELTNNTVTGLVPNTKRGGNNQLARNSPAHYYLLVDWKCDSSSQSIKKRKEGIFPSWCLAEAGPVPFNRPIFPESILAVAIFLSSVFLFPLLRVLHPRSTDPSSLPISSPLFPPHPGSTWLSSLPFSMRVLRGVGIFQPWLMSPEAPELCL